MHFNITENTDQNHMTAAAFKRAVKIAGLTLPEFDPATVPTADWTPASVEEIADAAFKVAATGKDPASDKNVQALLTSRLLANTIGGLYHRNQVALSKAELQHYEDHAPTLLEELTTAFDDAVETMEAAIPLIGHASLEDSLRETGNMRAEKAQAVTSAHVANSRTRHLVDALPVIAAAANGAELMGGGGHYGLLKYCKPTHQQFIEHRLSSQSTRNGYDRPHNVWDLLSDGITVELATTADEVKARIRRIESDVEELGHDRRAEAAQHAEARAQAKAMGF